MTQQVSRFRLPDDGMASRAVPDRAGPAPVHQLQARVARAAPRVVARSSQAAVAVDHGDWSEF